MVFRFDEKPASSKTTDNPPSYETTWIAAGETNASTVRAYAFQATPFMVAYGGQILYRDDIAISEQGRGVFNVVPRYVTSEEQAKNGKPPLGQFSFEFSTTGGTFHITRAKEHVKSYPDDALTQNGFINVTKKGKELEVEGTDIIIPALKLTITFSHPLGIVTLPYARTLAGLTSAVNSGPFLGFEAGEVIFLGAEGGDGTQSEASVKYHFACEQNLANQVYGTVTGVVKDGQDFLWIESKLTAVDGKAKVDIHAVHIERTYRRVDLKAALGFG